MKFFFHFEGVFFFRGKNGKNGKSLAKSGLALIILLFFVWKRWKRWKRRTPHFECDNLYRCSYTNHGKTYTLLLLFFLTPTLTILTVFFYTPFIAVQLVWRFGLAGGNDALECPRMPLIWKEGIKDRGVLRKCDCRRF